MMNTTSRVFCPSGCVDDHGKRVVTRTFRTGGFDGDELYRRVSEAPLCTPCRAQRQRTGTPATHGLWYEKEAS